jgi:hypothetical protein
MLPSLGVTCPLCGLRFTNRALVELHLRDDHQRRRPEDGRPQPAQAGLPGRPALSSARHSEAARFSASASHKRGIGYRVTDQRALGPAPPEAKFSPPAPGPPYGRRHGSPVRQPSR